MANSHALIAALLLPVLCSSAPAEQNPRAVFASALPFCQMMAMRTKYVGHKLAVSGLYAATPHGGMIYGRECPNDAIFLSAKGIDGGWVSPQANAVFDDVYRDDTRVVHVPVVIVGVLRATPAVTPCSKDSCMKYKLEEARFIVALPDVVVR